MNWLRACTPAGYTAVQIPGAPVASSAHRVRIRRRLPAEADQDAIRREREVHMQQRRWLPLTARADKRAKGRQRQDHQTGRCPLSITSTYDAGQTAGGFDDAFFYNNYKQKVLDYYQPDEQRRWDGNAAQRDLTYSLARAGTLQSSTAADKRGELAITTPCRRRNGVPNTGTQREQHQEPDPVE